MKVLLLILLVVLLLLATIPHGGARDLILTKQSHSAAPTAATATPSQNHHLFDQTTPPTPTSFNEKLLNWTVKVIIGIAGVLEIVLLVFGAFELWKRYVRKSAKNGGSDNEVNN